MAFPFPNAYSPTRSPSPPPLTKHDVFISFRGADTRNSFTSHLCSALRTNQIDTFMDDKLEKGGQIWTEIVQAIQDSKVFLVVLSENYARSRWCLRELAEIMELRKKIIMMKNTQEEEEEVVVIPVFYKIEPTHVRNQKGSYYEAFCEHERRCDHGEVMQWRTALFQAANISGFHITDARAEADLVGEITKKVLGKLKNNQTVELGCNFICDQNFAYIESLLRFKSKEALVIGIWGMGGIGKRTIAAAVFNQFSYQYEGCCFLENSRELERQDLNRLYNALFSQLLNEDFHADTFRAIPSSVIRRLKYKKVLIVLAGLNNSQIVADLVRLAREGLKAGSRVILTTRDRNVLTSGGVEKIHQVKEMNDQDSHQLFRLHAFDNFIPTQEYYDLSIKALAYAKGLPLALKILGSFLRSKRANEWESALKKLRKYPHPDIQKVLRLSYDGLDDEEKNILLDIACCFKGHGRSKVTRILNSCDFHAGIGIRILIDKALITTNSHDCIQIHYLMQEMCREIIREESSRNGGQKTRLWDAEEICNLLQNNRGIDAVESIFVDMNQITVDPRIIIRAFRKMPRLRLLALQGSIGMGLEWNRTDDSLLLPRDFKCPNNLRYIQWIGCPFKSLPSSCWPQKLVDLSIRDSHVQKLWDWNTTQNLPNLERIDLTGSKYLIACPNLSGAPILKHVLLNECESLVYIHPSIFYLQMLKELDVSGCKELRSLCSNYCSPSLQFLSAKECYNLEEFSVPMSGDHAETELFLRSTALTEVPSSILHLREIDFSFPISYSLGLLPENFAYRIVLSDSEKHKHDAYNTLCRILPSPAFFSVRTLVLCECESFSELPNDISSLHSLEKLAARGCTLKSLPKSIKYLQKLRILEVTNCKMLQYIPTLPPSVQGLDATNCTSLRTVSSLCKPGRGYDAIYAFHNCINLVQNAFDEFILKDLIERIEHGTILREDKNDVNKICYYLPSRKSLLRDWFPNYSKQSSVVIGVPMDIVMSLDFIFYLLLPCHQSCDLDQLVTFKCECYLMESSWRGWIHLASSSDTKWLIDHLDNNNNRIEILSDHVLFWYDMECCKRIREAIIEETNRGNYSTTWLKFDFFAQTRDTNEVLLIKECGIHRAYSRFQERREIEQSQHSIEEDQYEYYDDDDEP